MRSSVFPRPSRFWGFIVLVILGGVLLYSALWSSAPVLERTGDGPGYLEAACDLQDGRIDALHDRPPGYPAVLALLGACKEPLRAIFTMQALLHFIALLVLGLALARTTGSQLLVAILLVLGALPPAVAPAAYVRSETVSQLTIVLVVAGLLFWLRSGHRAWLVLVAFASAWAALVRPTYQGLGIVLALVLWLLIRLVPEFRGRLRVAALVLFVFPTLVVVSFSLFNHSRFDYFGLTPLFGFNLSTRTVHVLERIPDEEATIREVLIQQRDQGLVERDGDHRGFMYIWPARAELERATGLNRAQLSKYMAELNLWLILRSPLNYLRVVGAAVADFWMPGIEGIANFGSRPVQLLWAMLYVGLNFLFWYSLLVLVGIGLVFATISEVRKAAVPPEHSLQLVALCLAWAVIFYTMLTSTLLEIGNPRYRAPTDLLIWFSTLLGFEIWRSFKSGPLRAHLLRKLRG